MKTLIEQLQEQTQDLKEQYVDFTRIWAEQNYNRISERLNWKDADWCKLLGITPEVRKDFQNVEFLTFPIGFYNTKGARVLNRLKSEVSTITTFGLEEYVRRELKDAELHYRQSIEKLVFRLNKKGVTDDSEFKISSGRIGLNFECTINHGGKVTRAFTILAKGEIQRPHYRYLVK